MGMSATGNSSQFQLIKSQITTKGPKDTKTYKMRKTKRSLCTKRFCHWLTNSFDVYAAKSQHELTPGPSFALARAGSFLQDADLQKAFLIVLGKKGNFRGDYSQIIQA